MMGKTSDIFLFSSRLNFPNIPSFQHSNIPYLYQFSVLKKAFPEIPPVLPFQREESFSFEFDKRLLFPPFEKGG